MKLVSLNAQGATQGKVFFDYVKEQAKDTDIFCFQEVFSAPTGEAREQSNGARVQLFRELERLLPDFSGIFDGTSKGHDLYGFVEFPLVHGLAAFVRKGLPAVSHGLTAIYGSPDDQVKAGFANIPRSVQEAKLQAGQKTLSIFNFHGIPLPGEKLDTPDRLEQSAKLLGIWQKTDGAKILCGDFNLMPETESIRMLEGKMRNLIREFKIENTRNEISWKNYGNKQCYADYLFVSPEIQVKSFQVPYVLASDHLPMILEFTI